ncbi:MAG: hypothetical protein NTW87_18265 [Planctomycetota bacterium]|nr:hypothetical protein [Planctomycetota bacterium]
MPLPGTRRTASRWLAIARRLLEQPTAPVKEQLPQAFVRRFARAHAALALTEDPAGNLLVKYPARGRPKCPPLVLVAHMDHPGFWIEDVAAGTASLLFKGGVGAGHARKGTRVRFFQTGRSAPTGAGKLVKVTEENGRLARATARITQGVARPNGFAMWDFPAFSIVNGLIVTRACDDVLGSAAALCALDEIARRRPRGVALWGLFTRAEEIGFMGALEAVRHRLVPKGARVLSLECSKAAGIAPQGEGVVVRVGDRASIFDPGLSEALRQAAERARQEHPDLKYQRKLMDGGSCEATVFCAYGYRASGLAVPLGNYHNQALVNGRPAIGPETVNVHDFLCEVQLLVELALHPELLGQTRGGIPDWLQERAADARRELCEHSPSAGTGVRKK